MKTHRTMASGKLLAAFLLISCAPGVGQVTFTTQSYQLNTAFPVECALQQMTSTTTENPTLSCSTVVWAPSVF